MGFWICVFKINVKTRMCFQSYAPKSWKRVCVFHPEGTGSWKRVCFFCVSMCFLKRQNPEFYPETCTGWLAAVRASKSFKKKTQKKMPHSALKIVATPAWWSKNEETIVCLLWLARFAFAECKKYVSPKKSPKRWIGANLEKEPRQKVMKVITWVTNWTNLSYVNFNLTS